MFRTLSILFAGVVALAWAGSVKADDDLVRLDGKGDADVTEARYYGGGYRGGWGGGYRGYYGGYRGYYGGWGRGYYGGWGRGYGWGYGYRPYYGIGIGLGYGSYYGGYYGGGYYPSYYYTPSYYAAPCTCSTAAPLIGDNVATSARPIVPQGDGTFPYDGGPRDAFFASSPGVDRPAAKRDGLLVSVPATDSGYRFLAFGEQASEPAARPATNNAPALRISYPAYGEPMPKTFSGGSTNYNVVLR